MTRALVRAVVIVTITTYVLIGVGSFVRASGSGLGCPDWPFCFGKLFPPMNIDDVPPELRAQWNPVKMWIEYTNRMVGVLLGILSLIALWLAARQRRVAPDVFRWVGVGVALVVITGGLGGRVVTSELDPRLVSIHLFLGLGAALAYTLAATRVLTPHLASIGAAALPPVRRTARTLTWIALALTFVQMVQGAVVRGSLELVSRAEPDLAREQWIDRVGFVDLSHRVLSLLVAALVIAAWFCVQRIERHETPRLHAWANANIAFVVAQIVAGFVLAYGPLPPSFQVIHVSVGAWLAGGLLVQGVLVGTSRGVKLP